MKRFYKTAGTAPAANDARGGFHITLDGKPVRTPAKAHLVVPGEGLAAAIAAEWQAQGEVIDPRGMGLMTLACTTLDRVRPQRSMVVDEVLRFAGTDLLCYRAEAPEALRDRQDAGWQPLLDWAAAHLGLRFVVTAGIVPVGQEPGLVEAARLHLDTYDDFTMVGTSKLTHGTGSVVLAMAVIEGRITADEAFALSQIDEIWQESLWGADDEAVEFRRTLRQDLLDAAEFAWLARA